MTTGRALILCLVAVTLSAGAPVAMALGCGNNGALSAAEPATSNHSHHGHHHAAMENVVDGNDVASDCDCCADCGSACSGSTAAANDLASVASVGLVKPPSPSARCSTIAADAHHSPLIRPPIRST